MPHSRKTLSVAPTTLAELLAAASENDWCTRFGCTTCGAMPFRKYLKGIPREQVISGLRQMDPDALQRNLDAFELVIRELSLFGTGGDLLTPLQGTPAGFNLQSYVDRKLAAEQRRMDYIASQTPEAISHRRKLRKANALRATESHRERKAMTQEAVAELRVTLSRLPDNELLTFISQTDLRISRKAVGGIVFDRLRAYLREQVVSNYDFEILKSLATEFGGHWSKLLGLTTKQRR